MEEQEEDQEDKKETIMIIINNRVKVCGNQQVTLMAQYMQCWPMHQLSVCLLIILS